eukprot:11899855-Prorocentrum_lima.AAC.1
MTSSLVGSEMCIRDRASCYSGVSQVTTGSLKKRASMTSERKHWQREEREAVSYTHLTLPTICSV